MAETETSPRQTATTADAEPPRASIATRAASQPMPVSLTYGSWMELGLAARQMMAASQPRETGAARGSRRR